MRKSVFMPILLLGLVAGAFAQQGNGNNCTPSGVWYGGSVVAYTLTITQTGPAGRYVTDGEGVYKTSTIGTGYQGTLEKRE